MSDNAQPKPCPLCGKGTCPEVLTPEQQALIDLHKEITGKQLYEGWLYARGVTRKCHYFRNGASLCRRITGEDIEAGNVWHMQEHPDDHEDNCAECRRRRAKEQEGF